MVIIVVLALSFGGSTMLWANYQAELTGAIERSIASHQLSCYFVEYKLLEDNLKSESFSAERIASHMRLIAGGEQNSYAKIIYKGKDVYSNTDYDLSFSVEEGYSIQEIDKKYILGTKTKLDYSDGLCYLVNGYDITEVFAERRRQYGTYCFILISVSCVAALAAWVTSYFLTKRIKLLCKTSERIAEGEYDLRADEGGDDEISALAKRTNYMVEALQGEISRRSAFVADFSHELKTPMTSMIGYSDILRSRVCTDEEKYMYADAIYRNCRRLETLSGKMMELLALSESRISLKTTNIRSIRNRFKRLFFDKTQVETEFEQCAVIADEELILTVLRNLSDNAIKASTAGEKIRIVGRKLPIGYRISVIDHGKGMTAEQLSHATDPFFKGDKSRSSQGAGIGLSICKRICELHGTELMFDSVLGEGTTVSFVLEVANDEE